MDKVDVVPVFIVSWDGVKEDLVFKWPLTDLYSL